MAPLYYITSFLNLLRKQTIESLLSSHRKILNTIHANFLSSFFFANIGIFLTLTNSVQLFGSPRTFLRFVLNLNRVGVQK